MARNVRAAVRRAVEYEYPWRPDRAPDDYYLPVNDFEYDPEDDWHPDDFGTDSAFGRDWQRRVPHQRIFKHQRRLLRLVDMFAAGVVAAAALDTRGSRRDGRRTSEALRRLSSSPHYVFELGRMPARSGDKAVFREHVRKTMLAALEKRNDAFPLRSAVGLTIFYVQRTNSSDLDNMFRMLVPIVMETLMPPGQDRHPWMPEDLLEEHVEGLFSVAVGQTGVQFIEAVTLHVPDDDAFPPGTLLLALSNGHRHESWWAKAESYMSAQERSDYAEPE